MSFIYQHRTNKNNTSSIIGVMYLSNHVLSTYKTTPRVRWAGFWCRGKHLWWHSAWRRGVWQRMCGGEWSGSHIEDPEQEGSKNIHNSTPATHQQIMCHSHIHTNAKQQQRTPLPIPSGEGSCTLDLQQQALKHEHQVTVAPHGNCCRHAPAVPCPRPRR